MEKQLFRSRNNKVIAGVCGGIAEYFNIDPTLVRVIWVAVSLVYGTGIIAYIIAAIIMPLNKGNSNTAEDGMGFGETARPYDSDNFDAGEWNSQPNYDTQKSRSIVGAMLIVLGLLFLGKQVLHFDMKLILPIVFIVIGIYIIYKGRGNRYE